MATHIVGNESKEEFDHWFGDLIHQIKTHKMMLETKTAPDKLEEFYNSLIEGDELKVIKASRQESTKYFVKRVVEAYLNTLSKTEVAIEKLAFSTSDERILVWAQIPDEDDESETELIIAQSKVNAKFHEFGFHIESMIVENSDNLSIPPQYFAVID